MDIRIRLATPDDLPHLLHHRRAMFEEMGHSDFTALAQMEQSSRDYFHNALRAGTYRGWIVEDSEKRVIAGGGIVLAAWPGFPGETHAKRAWILNMYTEPHARRRGIARRLVLTMAEWCRAEGLRSVWLHASHAGRPVYESLGFRPTNEMKLTL
jgi:GNAT superfamily N-acetyltransferase